VGVGVFVGVGVGVSVGVGALAISFGISMFEIVGLLTLNSKKNNVAKVNIIFKVDRNTYRFVTTILTYSF
jgi:tRNA A37 threonylcarbamoyladenosine modification protein TsaB